MTRLAVVLLVAGNLAAADYLLKITPETVAWGYYWSAAKPVLTVKSGDTVTVDGLKFTRVSEKKLKSSSSPLL